MSADPGTSSNAGPGFVRRTQHLRLQLAPALWVAALVGITLFVVAFNDGGYGLQARSIIAIATWWSLILGVGLSLWPRARPPRAALLTSGLIAAFTAWTLASAAWSPSSEDAFTEFNRAALYLGVLLLTISAVSKVSIGRVADGLALGIVATGVTALISRFAPSLFSDRGLATYVPYSASRLSFPVGYWNGLGILLAIGVPLCLRGALLARHPLTRALSVGSVPCLAAAVYLTSSRGAVATAIVGVCVFLIATDRRWNALAATVAAVAGSALSVAVLVSRPELVNLPVTSATEGRGTAVAMLLGCSVFAGTLLAVAERTVRGRPAPRPAVGRTVAVILLALTVAGIALAHPARRLDEFKQPLSALRIDARDPVRSHLLSGNGSGRWQFWTAAVDEFKTDPFKGQGAGSYQSWWLQHASFTYFLRNAHSLYLEVLGELGVVGFVLLVGALLVGLAGGIARARITRGAPRVTSAALIGAFVAFGVSVGVDWVWQLTVVGLVGVVLLGLLVAPAVPAPTLRARPPRRGLWGLAGGAIFVVAAWAVTCAQALPWLSSARIADSQAAIRSGHQAAAIKDALDARRLQPWAASPYLQLALVAEQAGKLDDARRWLVRAIHRDSEEWQLWYVSFRIETKAGNVRAARRSLIRAKSLNPRSALFAGLSDARMKEG